MPRVLRIQAAGLLYHVGSRGVDKQPIFDVVPRDRERFLELVAIVVTRYGWRLHAYCLMGNHFHLILETPHANLAEGMRYLKGRYAQWLNHQKGREGALFERRYWYRIAVSEAYVLTLTRYVVLNPVRAGWCDEPEGWKWSSYLATAGLQPAPHYLTTEDVLGWFGQGDLAHARYRAFVHDGIELMAPAIVAGGPTGV